jgi:hypothetical protein
MKHLLIERAEELIARLMDRVREDDPDGLYAEAIEQLGDLAAAFSAAQKVIAGLCAKLERSNGAGKAG